MDYYTLDILDLLDQEFDAAMKTISSFELRGNMPDSEKPQYPDLRTKEGASQFLNYHSPNAEDIEKHEKVNDNFQALAQYLWDVLPDGPGKTIFIRKLNDARMSANSCIANNGA